VQVPPKVPHVVHVAAAPVMEYVLQPHPTQTAFVVGVHAVVDAPGEQVVQGAHVAALVVVE